MKSIVFRILILSLALCPSHEATARSVIEDGIALIGNASSFGLYSRQLEIDIAQAKLNIEKEYAEKMSNLRDQALAERIRILSARLADLESRRLRLEFLKNRAEEAFSQTRKARLAANDVLRNDLNLAENLKLLESAIQIEQGSLANLASVLSLSEKESGACENGVPCHALELLQALQTGRDGEETTDSSESPLLELSEQFYESSKIFSLLTVAEESLRSLRHFTSVRLQLVNVEILATQRSLQELKK